MKLHSTDSEALLSEPATSSVPPTKIDRPSSSVTIEDKFDFRKNGCRQFSRQYAHSYTVRLWTAKPRLEELVAAEWKNVELKKISELCEFTQGNVKNQPGAGSKISRNSGNHGQHIAFKEDVTVALIGTIFKYQPEKPSILQELAEENLMVPVVPKTKYISDRDTIQLEDETTRVQLIPSPGCGLTVGGIVNGVICAVKGKPTRNGKFEVADVIYPTPRLKPILEQKLKAEIVFISGLELGRDKKSALMIDLLFDYLNGLSGSLMEVENSIQKRTRVFFVGNTFHHSNMDSGKDKNKTKTSVSDIAKKLDKTLDQISQTMDVFILPGDTDASEPMLPQPPLHRCIFPLASRRPTFNSLSNPARVGIPFTNDHKSDKLDLLLCSGQNIIDAVKNSDATSSLQMAQNMLRWGHLCPTAPDTLPLHPGVEDDVFVVEDMPHIFAVGNQPTFDAIQWKNTQIFTIPKFSETGTAIVMNSELELVPLTFQLL